jgi:hypothetical protein
MPERVLDLFADRLRLVGVAPDKDPLTSPPAFGPYPLH